MRGKSWILKQIRTFAAVYEDGSINSAANRLRVAQPSLSLQIKNLEDSVGVVLFERHARGGAPDGRRRAFLTKIAAAFLVTSRGPRRTCANLRPGVSGALNVGLIPTH